MTTNSRWHPWRTLRDHHPKYVVICSHRLHQSRMAYQNGKRIWLCSTLSQAERRCTLTHEIIHLERGPCPPGLAAARREEAVVNELTARRLITADALINAFRWQPHPNPADMAEELWVDVPTLDTRIRTLSPFEVADLERKLDGDWSYPRIGN